MANVEHAYEVYLKCSRDKLNKNAALNINELIRIDTSLFYIEPSSSYTLGAASVKLFERSGKIVS